MDFSCSSQYRPTDKEKGHADLSRNKKQSVKGQSRDEDFVVLRDNRVICLTRTQHFIRSKLRRLPIQLFFLLLGKICKSIRLFYRFVSEFKIDK